MTREDNGSAVGYFGNQQKKVNLADRRPVPRKPSDLGMGPAINVSATAITDFNNVLALCNGYFSALVGALNAPNDTDDFVGIVVMDAYLGGYQAFRSMTTGVEYVRMVRRNPSDADNIAWGAWV